MSQNNVKVIDRDTLLDERRAKAKIEERIPYRVDGETKHVVKKMAHGEMETYALPHDKTVGELLTTPSGLDTLVQKSIIDIEVGRERQPLLYGPLYRNRTNRRFTKTVQVGRAGTRGHAVFLEKLETEEVKFGTRTVGAVDNVPILTYAAGFEWTEDLEEFDETWTIDEANEAIGEAYNALLNHLHFYPLISYSYAGNNLQTWNPNAVVGTQYEKDRDTLQAALQKAALNKNTETGQGQTPTIVLAHSSNRFRVQDMLEGRTIGGTILQPIGQQIRTIILYDGWSDTVGERTYSYAGMGTGYILLVQPQTYLQELVKHDLLVDANRPQDLSRLVIQQIVARARRGVYAAPANCVTKMNLS